MLTDGLYDKPSVADQYVQERPTEPESESKTEATTGKSVSSVTSDAARPQEHGRHAAHTNTHTHARSLLRGRTYVAQPRCSTQTSAGDSKAKRDAHGIARDLHASAPATQKTAEASKPSDAKTCTDAAQTPYPSHFKHDLRI